jgi:uncharacterized UBP type Zn finger protein
MKVIEIRCPEDPRRLFSKLIKEGGKPVITDGNLIEFSCQNCKKALTARGIPVARVLHRYNIAGELVETVQDVL